MLKKSHMPLTAKQIVKMIEKNTIVFDNSIQRGLVWDNDRKSLLIHSMIIGYPVPPFYATKTDSGVLDCLDGKQRSNAINEFILGKFILGDLPELQLENGNMIDISGKSFEQLPEEFQDAIKDYPLVIYNFEDISDDEVNEMFFRLNNGKPLSAIELTRVKAKSIEQIKAIGEHPIFLDALTERALNRYTHEDIAIKAYAILYTENPSFETKKIRPLMESVEITDDQRKAIETAFTRIQESYKAIKQMKFEDESENKIRDKAAKRVLARTHLTTLVPIALDSVTNGIGVDAFAKWLLRFYSGKKSASISEVYNECASAGSARPDAIQARLTAAFDDYKEFCK